MACRLRKRAGSPAGPFRRSRLPLSCAPISERAGDGSMTSPMLGCIADDLTGATDLANNLVRAGMRAVLTVDVPSNDDPIDTDAIVVALKSRTIPAAEAAEQSLRACRWLRRQGARQLYFKVCSTFDST